MTALRTFLRALGWPIRKLLLVTITFYRTAVSPMLGPRCKYYPTCSGYALHAVEVHGAAKGAALASWRLLRCNPFSKGGFDPVPDRGRWLPDVYPDGRPRQPAANQQPPAPSAPREA